MKLATLAFILLCIGCSTAPEKKEPMNMAGVYKIRSVGIKTDKLDTTYTNSTQLKIYTKDYMMYANINVPDSVSGFGIGSYSVDGDTVTENVIYSASDTVASDKPTTFKLAVQKTPGGYKQFIAGMQNNAGQKFDMTETYDSVETAASTAVDGAWKLVKRYTVKGKDTTNSTGTQYKAYYAGYIIWGATWKDSLSKTHTGLGFGKFTMPAEHKVKESMTTSTYYQVRGHDFDIDIEMMGADGLKQTMNNSDGSKSVEVYERLK